MNPTIEDIKIKVCEVFGITMEQLMSNNRSQKLAAPRCVAYYLCCTYTNQSTIVIGKFLNRDHSTVIVGQKNIFKIREKYPAQIAALVCHFHKLKNRDYLAAHARASSRIFT